MLQLGFGESKPDKSQSKQSITKTRKVASCSMETLKSNVGCKPAAVIAPSRTQTIFGEVLCWLQECCEKRPPSIEIDRWRAKRFKQESKSIVLFFSSVERSAAELKKSILPSVPVTNLLSTGKGMVIGRHVGHDSSLIGLDLVDHVYEKTKPQRVEQWLKNNTCSTPNKNEHSGMRSGDASQELTKYALQCPKHWISLAKKVVQNGNTCAIKVCPRQQNTFNVQHLRDVKILFSNFEGSGQTAHRIILKAEEMVKGEGRKGIERNLSAQQCLSFTNRERERERERDVFRLWKSLKVDSEVNSCHFSTIKNIVLFILFLSPFVHC